MVEKIEMTDGAISYIDLIKEAFVAPIRSVTVVDDEYPTLSEFISNAIQSNPLNKNIDNLERLKNIIEMCHKDLQWSVDVFDGKSPNWGDGRENIPMHLHHSDLLILDYHLDGESNQTDGTRARKILLNLDDNNHFNIVLVHTKGSNDDIESVYNEILQDFLNVPQNNSFICEEKLKSKIEDWLDINDIDRNAFPFTETTLGMKEVLKFVDNYNINSVYNLNSSDHLLYSFRSDIEKLAEQTSISINEIINWFISIQIEKVTKHLQGSHNNKTLKWEWDRSDKINFICSSKVFITVIKKDNQDPKKELYDQLCESLKKFNPSPMHLLLAKIRHLVDERGLEQANQIISNKYAQAGWLYNLLNKSPKNVLEHDHAIDIHWEQLGKATKGELIEFSKKLCKIATQETHTNKDFVEIFFPGSMQEPDLPIGHLNAFSCSMSPVSKHLTTGSILEFDNSFWICLTPVCDLVPGQKIKLWQERIGDHHLVFKAVKLQSTKLNKANKSANTNDYLFIENKQGDVDAYQIPSGKDNPVWDTFYALNQGHLDVNYKLSLSCIRKTQEAGTEPSTEENQNNMHNQNLAIRTFEAKVIAELRYSYALNFLQKFGVYQTRVGLGFIDRIL